MKAARQIPRLLALVAQVITFAGFVVITAGLAKLQKKTNALGTLDEATTIAYDTTYSYSLITPYAGRHGFQFSYIWFIIFFEFTLLLITLAVTFVPMLTYAGRPAALSLLAVAFTLVITVVNNLTYLHSSPTAELVYGKKDINVTFAGALLVAIGNAFTILALGFWVIDRPGTHVAATTTPHYGTTANQAKREVETGTV